MISKILSYFKLEKNNYDEETKQNDREQFFLYEINKKEESEIPGYLVVSTAPDIFDSMSGDSASIIAKPSKKKEIEDLRKESKDPALNRVEINKLADQLYELDDDKNPKEVVIEIHGYNTDQGSTKDRYKKTHSYINTIIKGRKNLVFLGYRWPSEKLIPPLLTDAVATLPVTLLWVFIIGIILILTCFSPLLLNFNKNITILLAFLSGFLVSLVVSLILLRLSVYFRDSYRATNFAVSDLVELIRQLDYILFEKAKVEKLLEKLPGYFERENSQANNPILQKLNFSETEKSPYIDKIVGVFAEVYLRNINDWKKEKNQLIKLFNEECFIDNETVNDKFLEDEFDKIKLENLLIYLKEDKEKNIVVVADSKIDAPENLQNIITIYCKYWKDKIDDITSKMLEDKELKCCDLNENDKENIKNILWLVLKNIEKNYEFIAENLRRDLDSEKHEKTRRVKLSFIGHSMGAFVTTNVIRIISDVFDYHSVNTIHKDYVSQQQASSAQIGRFFYLGRLVLVSPDIPVGTITSGRSNFLRSSLRRFQEAYLFSNEGDLALRFASTIANYFIFPASKLSWGYRLGNLTIRSEKNNGILNLSSLKNDLNLKSYASNKTWWEEQHLAKYLGLTILGMDDEHISNELTRQAKNDKDSIADLFTYFDCTDYEDVKIYSATDSEKGNCNRPKRILSWRLNYQDSIKSIVYFFLFIAWISNKIDVHGGYFEGELSSKLIYKLAFLSFSGVLGPPDCETRLAALDLLCQDLDEKHIRAVLSPERYIVDVLLKRSRRYGRLDVLNAEK